MHFSPDTFGVCQSKKQRPYKKGQNKNNNKKTQEREKKMKRAQNPPWGDISSLSVAGRESGLFCGAEGRVRGRFEIVKERRARRER